MTGGSHFVEITLKLLHTEKSFSLTRIMMSTKPKRDQCPGSEGKHILDSNTVERGRQTEKEKKRERRWKDEKKRRTRMSWQVEENQLLRGTH